MGKVTKKQAESVLAAVAEWMQTKGYGSVTACGSCEGCTSTETRFVIARQRYGHEDPATVCDHCDPLMYCDKPKFGPAPTGEEAAARGLGPVLRMDFDWIGLPGPAVILEGGPYDWAISCSFEVQEKVGSAVFVEPITSWALGIYPG